MASPNRSVLVFGPTGAVGCAAATEAHKRGASVWLAMRDTSKPISGLDDQKGSSQGYTRVQADLSAPESLKAAVQQSGAKAAFVYTIHDSPDNMRSAFDALKEAGITFVVLLSSYNIQGSARDEKNHEGFIERVHAKTEVALEDSGLAHVAVRPAYFNSNIFWFYNQGIQNGEVDVLYPNLRFDYIAPEDIGAVCGALLNSALSSPSQTSSRIISICGPELLSQREAIGVIGRALGHEIKINEVNEQEWSEKLKHMPRPILDTLVKGMRKSHEGYDMYPKETYDEAVKTIEKYAGRKPKTLGEWVLERKDAFA